MATLIITEKTSQARDLRSALGDRVGQILPAEGHLLRLAEPHEVDPSWKAWACVLLKPAGLYPTQPATDGNKPAKLRAIAAALKACDEVILATDCDREGQLIGQEILEHYNFRGRVRRALFTAQDPKSLRQAFAALKPNTELRPLYEAAVARQQADQIFNLSLTRTATKSLLARGVKGVIGIGRVRTPTLAIVCMRELEIRNFKVEDYFEIVATAKVTEGHLAGASGAHAAPAQFLMRHAPPVKARIRDKAVAETIAAAAAKFTGPLAVSVEHRRQAPPRLYDLPALQKTCGQRWGWNADKTLAVAQELYDGEAKKLITYPRAEARHLAENQIADVPAIVAALTRLRGFASLEIDPPVIRRGKSGHFCDKSLEGVSHHAVVPNVNVLDDVEARIARLSDDEKRLFALICRSYLAAVMPDYEYRQTVVTMQVPVILAGPPPKPIVAEFRAVGRIPLKLGWKAAFGAVEPDTGAETEAEQTLPQLTNGQSATLTRPKVEAKKTQPPPRYNEGTLIDAMQNAWRFVADEALRERLKEAKGIGTPATRAQIITGLKRQNMIAADGKLVIPTPAGLQLFELLKAAAPALVDPGLTAVWEIRLDDVVLGRADFKRVIDEIASEAGRLIAVLRQHTGPTVDLSQPAPRVGNAGAGRQRSSGEPSSGKNGYGTGKRKPRAARTQGGDQPKPERKRKPKPAEQNRSPEPAARATRPQGPAQPGPEQTASSAAPTARMVAFAERLARDKKVGLPPGYARDFETCRRFLDQHAGR